MEMLYSKLSLRLIILVYLSNIFTFFLLLILLYKYLKLGQGLKSISSFGDAKLYQKFFYFLFSKTYDKVHAFILLTSDQIIYLWIVFALFHY